MKKYYKFGEILLVLREEYNSYKYILKQLNNCLNVKDKNVCTYFSGNLADEDLNRELMLVVEKKYFDILKKIQYIKNDWYSQYLYKAFFVAEKDNDGLYELAYDNIKTPVDERKYIPKVEIIDQNKFSNLTHKLLSTDLMQLQHGYFRNNQDNISLDFDDAYINTTIGDGSLITWNGMYDNFEYLVTRHNSPALIEEILSLEMPANKIAPDWLKLLEKHENDFAKDIVFNVDINAQSKKGILYISNIEDNRVVRLLKK